MTAKDTMKSTIDMAGYITTTYLNDLSDAELMTRPTSAANHIAWQLGHLIASAHRMMTGVGAEMPDLPDGFAESHSKEAATTDAPGKFCTKDEYLALMTESCEATKAAIDAAPDADLSKPAPESMRAYAATVGAVYNMIGVHILMHVGQFAVVRRQLGKPIVM
jgi:hypothetical protein